MTTETATLLAVMGTPLAVVALITAVTVMMGVRRARRGLARATDRLDGATDHLGHELRAGRATLGHATTQLRELRSGSRSRDKDVGAWTASLREVRGTIARLDQRRLTPAVRAVRWAGALGRVALMWRTPGR